MAGGGGGGVGCRGGVWVFGEGSGWGVSVNEKLIFL